jgi:uncharacterized membrane protein
MFDYAGGSLDVFVYAVVAGWLAVRTGGLEASIALAVVYLSPRVHAEDGRDLGWPHVITIGAVLLFAAAAVWLARRRHIQTVSAARQASQPVPVTSQ